MGVLKTILIIAEVLCSIALIIALSTAFFSVPAIRGWVRKLRPEQTGCVRFSEMGSERFWHC